MHLLCMEWTDVLSVYIKIELVNLCQCGGGGFFLLLDFWLISWTIGVSFSPQNHLDVIEERGSPKPSLGFGL